MDIYLPCAWKSGHHFKNFHDGKTTVFNQKLNLISDTWTLVLICIFKKITGRSFKNHFTFFFLLKLQYSLRSLLKFYDGGCRYFCQFVLTRLGHFGNVALGVF